MLVWNLLDQAVPAQRHILLEPQPEMLIRCAREWRQQIRLCIHPSDDYFYNINENDNKQNNNFVGNHIYGDYFNTNNNNKNENDNNHNKNFVENILIRTTLLKSSTYLYNLCAWADRSCGRLENKYAYNKQTTRQQHFFYFITIQQHAKIHECDNNME